MVGDILQPTHLLFVLIVALVVLGPKRLPEVARTLGDGLRDFKAAINGEHADDANNEHDHYVADDGHTGDDISAGTPPDEVPPDEVLPDEVLPDQVLPDQASHDELPDAVATTAPVEVATTAPVEATPEPEPERLG